MKETLNQVQGRSMQNNNSMMDEVTPTQFFLSQNYPNPFSEKTTIKYCVAYKTRVQIAVYNTEGEEIEKLVDEEKGPGTYEVEFSVCRSGEGMNLNQGYYFYRMIAGDFTSEKKWLCINKLSGRLNMKSLLQSLFFFLLVTQICFAQWVHQNSGTSFNLGGCYFVDSNNGWIVGESGTILNTTNGGIDWVSVPSGTFQNLAKVSFVDSVTGWICGNEGIIIKTSTGGTSWIKQDSGACKYLCGIQFINSSTGWAVGGDYATYQTKIIKTTNGGNNWIAQIDSSGALLYDCFFIDSVTGWAVGDYSLILKTTNGGSSWIKQYEGSWEPGFLGVFFTDYYNGWVTGWNGVMMRTSNGGNSWSNYPTGTWATIGSIYFIDSMNGWITARNDPYFKMIRTTDGGSNWYLQNIPITGQLAQIVFTDINTGWVSGDGGSILHTTNAGVTFVEEELVGTKPNSISLLQNYPNPFNPSTSFTYSIPNEVNVIIKVFDITGNEIETLVDEEKPAGTYEVTWNAENLPSGVYCYQLRAGSFIETKKMLLLK
jgi:photosystem II stability/assembly factor-like uncharacterized protein